MLITPQELAPYRRDPSWIIFDCRHDLMDHARGRALYAQGHIEGAFFADVEAELSGVKTGTNGRHPLPAPGDFAAFLQRHGVTSTTRVVAYDDVGGQYAARLWWLCRWIGLRNAALLDGGFAAWTAAGLPIATDAPPPRAGGLVRAAPDPEFVVTVEDLSAAADSRTFVVVDARSPERFRGETEPIDAVAGHIPGARNRFFKANLNADLTLRPPGDLRREWEALLAGSAPGTVVHQCGSGITACANLFAMEYAGLGGSRLYAGSWSEWIADARRPIARGA